MDSFNSQSGSYKLQVGLKMNDFFFFLRLHLKVRDFVETQSMLNL